MVIWLYAGITLLARVTRFPFQGVLFVAQLPLLLVGCVGVLGGWALYKTLKVHRPMVYSLKWTLRVGMWVRGIHIRVEGPKDGQGLHMPGLHVCNDAQSVAWILFAALPYNSLILPLQAFFSNGWINAILFLMGFYPKEHGIHPEDVHQWPFRVTPYVEQGFGVWEPVYFEYRDMQEVPYILKLAIQRRQPLHVWSVTGTEGLYKVHWLWRRVVRLRYITEIPISRRLPVSMGVYEHTIQTWFGPVLTHVVTQTSPGSGMPTRSSVLAKEKIASAKKERDGLETEGPDRTA
jgi:hypothetical protein